MLVPVTLTFMSPNEFTQMPMRRDAKESIVCLHLNLFVDKKTYNRESGNSNTCLFQNKLLYVSTFSFSVALLSSVMQSLILEL